MLKIVLVDDEKYIRDELKYFLGQIEGTEIVGETGDGDEVLELVENEKPDIVFLDIELGHANGLTIARSIMGIEDPPQIIISTAYDKYAVMGFELSVSDYILKPFSLERVRSAVEKASDDRGAKSIAKAPAEKVKKKIAASRDNRIYLLDVKDIMYAQARGNFSVIETSEGTFSLSASLKELSEALPSRNFIRIHKSNIVNIEFIDEIVPWFNYTCKLKLKGSETELTVSRNYYKEFKERFMF